jgi:hypothetical protein
MEKRLSAAGGRLATLLKESDDEAVMNALYLATLAREATEAERALVRTAHAADAREAVFRDLFWALLNAKEFTFNH